MYSYTKLAKILAKTTESLIDEYIKALKVKGHLQITSKEDALLLAQHISPRYVKLILETNQDNDAKLENLLAIEVQKLILIKLTKLYLSLPRSSDYTSS